MTITAAKLGSSPLMIDWTGLGAIPTHGLSGASPLAESWKTLHSRFDSGEIGFYQTPTDAALSRVGPCEELAKNLLSSGRYTDCLFLGIGGSALGPLSMLSALQERVTTAIRFHIIQNTDPFEWKSTLKLLNPDTTLVVAVSKSGTTFETLAQLTCALDWLTRARWKSHVVAITDPEKGDLRSWAQSEGVPTLAIAPSIGGRFSIFTPVGLFAAALSGLSVSDFLSGAKSIRDYCEKAAPEKNPLFILGAELIRQAESGPHKRPIHVCMPYSSRLQLIGDWFVQLWAESIGKDGKGFTPIAAMGATDQHSILQLLRDGPDDKVTAFLTIADVPDPVKLPKPLLGSQSARLPAFRILEGHSLQDLLMIEYRATSLVLTRRGRPHFTLQVEKLDEKSLGALYFALAVMTAFTGTHWGVDPFDQPGVEEGKIYIREALNQSERADPQDEINSPVGRLRREPSRPVGGEEY